MGFQWGFNKGNLHLPVLLGLKEKQPRGGGWDVWCEAPLWCDALS